jgi:hypothetical protein
VTDGDRRPSSPGFGNEMEGTQMKNDKAAKGVASVTRTGVLPLAVICLLVLAAAFAAVASADEEHYDLVYFDGHMHTTASDGSGSMADIKAVALKRGLSAVLVTNHARSLDRDNWANLNRQARELSSDRFLMINAFEVTGSEGLFNRDHVLAWGAANPFVGDATLGLSPEEVWTSPANPAGTGALYPANIAKWVDFIHRQGGIAVHAHTTGTTNPTYGVDFIEVFNLSHVKDVARVAEATGFPAAQAWGLGLTLNNMAIYGERDLTMPVALPGMPPGMTLPLRDALHAATGQWLGGSEAPLHSWDELLMDYVSGELHHPTFGVADSDAHNTGNVGAGPFSDGSNDDSDVGEAKNGVLVDKLTQRSLLAAIKDGRCFATTGPSLSFTVNDKLMGETATLKMPRDRGVKLRLSVDAQSATAVIAKITIVKNGAVLKTMSPMTHAVDTLVTDSADEDGYYRVEVVAVDASGAYQFAYSNPVFVKALRTGHDR